MLGTYRQESTQTGPAGEWQIVGVPPGGTDICYTAAFTEPYAPSCPDNAAGYVDLAPGSTEVFDETLLPTATIHVHATDDLGSPLQITAFALIDPLDRLAGGHSSTYNPDGTATIPFVPAGTYVLCVEQATGPSPQGYLVQDANACNGGGGQSGVEVHVTSGELDEVTVVLPRAGAISGEITDATGAPVANQGVVLRLRESPDDPQTDPIYQSATGDYAWRTAPDGSFSITGIPPGTYDVCFGPVLSPCYGQEGGDATSAAPVVVTTATTTVVDEQEPADTTSG